MAETIASTLYESNNEVGREDCSYEKSIAKLVVAIIEQSEGEGQLGGVVEELLNYKMT